MTSGFARWAVALLLVSAPSFAQVPSPVLTLNQDRLYVASEFGQRVQSELEAASAELSAENRRIEARVSGTLR